MRKKTPDAEAEQLSGLIGKIYDCVLDPGQWYPALDEVRKFVRCANVSLGVIEIPANSVRFQKVIGIEPEWLAKSHGYAADIAEFYGAMPDLKTRPIDEPVSLWRDCDRAVVLANRYYREWARPQGLIDFLGLNLMRSADRIAELGFGRHESAGLVTDRDIRRLRLLAPHLRRAIAITDLLDMKSLEVEAFGGALDALAAGILLVSGDGAILHANKAAAAMLARGTPIATARRKLRVIDPVANGRLLRLIALAVANDVNADGGGVGMALPGRAGEMATAYVLPLACGELRNRLEPRAVAAVFVAPDLKLPISGLDAVAEAFGLTPAETRLLDRLAQGESIADAAAAMNVSATTVKTHRSRLLVKTGARRQTEMIALVHRLVPAVCTAAAPASGARLAIPPDAGSPVTALERVETLPGDEPI